MTDNRQRRHTDYKNIARFSLAYWGRRKMLGFISVGLMMLALASDIFFPVIIGRMVDTLAAGPSQERLDVVITYFLWMMALAALFVVLRGASVYVWNIFAVRNMYDIVTESMHKVQRFSSDWHANAFAGATVRKVTRGMWAFDVLEDTFFFGLLTAFGMMILTSILLLVKVPDVGLFAVPGIIAYVVFSIWASVFVLSPKFRTSAESDTCMGATLADIITGNATVKAFGAEQREDAIFDSAALSWRIKSASAWQSANTMEIVRSTLRVSLMGGMIGLAVWMWKNGQATAGDATLVLTSFLILSGYMRDIGMHISNLQKSASEMEDVVHFWMREDEVRDRDNAGILIAPRGEIVFDRVSFTYKGQEKPVFHDFSITIHPGEKIALVGPSGSGKSTFVKLLQRLYDVNDGEIRIDGQNIADVTQESLRRAIALVPQDPVLFHRTLADNIAYGNPAATDEEIAIAAREAYAEDFIRQLPMQYKTLVGERGVKLSGGERQRVAIARAFLARASILVFDEATSSLDSISEHVIQKALQHLMDGRTTITIAHRLATVRNADRILVFERGRIVEQGSHIELLHRAGSHYKALYEMQALDLVG